MVVRARFEEMVRTWDQGTWDQGAWDQGAWDQGTWDQGAWDQGAWDKGTWDHYSKLCTSTLLNYANFYAKSMFGICHILKFFATFNLHL